MFTRLRRLRCLLFGCKGPLEGGARCERCGGFIVEPWPGPPPIPNYRAIGAGVAAAQARYKGGGERPTTPRPAFPSAQHPHCDPRILHAPGQCEHCDRRPEAQRLREAWGIAFTGQAVRAGQLPCPADHARGDSHQKWHGNRPGRKKVALAASPSRRSMR